MSDNPENLNLNYTPKSIGQILDRTLHLFLTNVRLLIGISAVPPAMLFLALGGLFSVVMPPHLVAMPKTPNPGWESQTAMSFISIAGAAYLLFVAALAPTLAAVSNAAVHADFGTSIRLREAYTRSLERFGRYLLLLVLIGIITTCPVLVVQLIMFASTALVAHGASTPSPALIAVGALGGALVLVCFVYSILATLRLSLAFPACVTEDLTAIAAIRRSSHLTRGAMGRIFLVLLIVYAITYVAYMIGMFVTFSVLSLSVLAGSLLHFHLARAASVPLIICLAAVLLLVMIFGMALSFAGYSTALAVMYNDQRMRIDGSPKVVGG